MLGVALTTVIRIYNNVPFHTLFLEPLQWLAQRFLFSRTLGVVDGVVLSQLVHDDHPRADPTEIHMSCSWSIPYIVHGC